MSKRTNAAAWVESAHRWQIKVQKDGVRRMFVSATPGRKGKREAEVKADAWLAAADGGADPFCRLEEVYPLWLASVQQRTSQSNWRPIESRWRTHVLPVLGRKRLDRLTEGDWQDLVDAIYAEGKSKKSLQLYCADIRALYKWLRIHGYTEMRLEQLKPPKGARGRQRTVVQPDGLRVLFASDVSTFRGQPCVDPLVRAYRFAVAAGLRPGELRGLQWRDIPGYRGSKTAWGALVGAQVWIRRSINIHDEITEGKNENAQRSFVMFGLLVDLLKEQHRYTGKAEYIFPIESTRTFYGAWQRYCGANGIPRTSLYELRHTFVSIVKVLPAGEVQPWVGHSQDMDTFGVYGHALTGEASRAAADIAALYSRLLSPADESGY